VRSQVPRERGGERVGDVGSKWWRRTAWVADWILWPPHQWEGRAASGEGELVRVSIGLVGGVWLGFPIGLVGAEEILRSLPAFWSIGSGGVYGADGSVGLIRGEEYSTI
jgi:hypothetical protein